jgi:hypothetical protein
MKRFLLLLALAAFLAIPAISLADGGATGSGTVPSITVKATSIKDVTLSNGQTSVMKTESFVLKNGSLAFAVMSTASFNKNNGGSQAFKCQIFVPGPAANANGAKLSNLFINMSGFVLNAKQTKSAVVGQGALNGFVTHTDSAANGGQTGTVNFTGAYTMRVALAGWVTSNGNTNPTKGSMAVTMTLSGIFDPSSGAPQPTLITLTMPATAFKIPGTGIVGGTASTWTMNVNMTSGPESPQSITVTLNLTQYGNNFIGTMTDPSQNVNNVSGTINGSNFTMMFSDTNQNNVPETVTITGIIAGTIGSGATMSGTFSSTTGDSGDWNATEN